MDGRSSNAYLLSYTEAGLSNDVLPIPSIHPSDCLYHLTPWDIVSLVILRGIVFLVISWDIHSLTILWDIHSLLISRDIVLLVAPRDIVFPINSRDIVFPSWHDRKLFEFGRCLPLFSWHDRKFIRMNENFGELEILSYKWIIRWTRVKVSQTTSDNG